MSDAEIRQPNAPSKQWIQTLWRNSNSPGQGPLPGATCLHLYAAYLLRSTSHLSDLSVAWNWLHMDDQFDGNKASEDNITGESIIDLTALLLGPWTRRSLLCISCFGGAAGAPEIVADDAS